MNNQKKLNIPENSPDRDDYISGIGAKEVSIILVSLMVSIVIIIFVYIGSKSLPVSFFIGVFCLSSTIVMVRRDTINESMIDKIKILIRYLRMQKKYEYYQYDVFSVSEDTDGQEPGNDSK